MGVNRYDRNDGLAKFNSDQYEEDVVPLMQREYLLYPLEEIQNVGMSLVVKALECADEVLSSEKSPVKDKMSAGNMVLNVLKFVEAKRKSDMENLEDKGGGVEMDV